MHDARVQKLNDAGLDHDGRYVLYWMQQSQRASFNHALEYAARRANALEQGMIVCFGLTDDYPEANLRHYNFMLEGLAEVNEALHDRGIKFVMRKGPPDEVALHYAQDASIVVCDRGYLRLPRQWRKHVAGKAGKCVIQVEGDAVVPVESASDKSEYAARTLRPKLEKNWPDFLAGLRTTRLKKSSLALDVSGDLDPGDIQSILGKLDIDHDVATVSRFRGGTAAARKRLQGFLQSSMDGYADARSDAANPQTSELSPYLHFGQISPVEIARKVSDAKGGSEQDRGAYLEELIVRRELAINYVFFEPNYDSYSALPDWARKTMEEHKDDARPARYTRAEMENAETDDEYWNAAMREMLKTGYMHNYMRMYWGKKILEWCNTPRYAFSTTLYLNNKYFLDGRDANSYANVAWIFGLHDRAWQERPVFGKVRSMTASGLERKLDIEGYVRWVEQLDESG